MKLKSKINLGLYVTEKRTDGYHNLETCFLPIDLGDELDITASDDAQDHFDMGGNEIDCPLQDNLIYKALMAVRNRYEVPPIHLRFRKIVPTGAGLGGGSADAAYTVTMLNDLFALGMTDAEMEQLVSPLGADCAVFVRSIPVMATGIGNIFHPLHTTDLVSDYQIVLVKPDDFVSTREAYSAIHPHLPAEPLGITLQRPIEEWKDYLLNDFEESVFPLHPHIQNVKEALYAMGATYACMSGSGATVFALFRDKQDEAELKRRFPDCFVWCSDAE